MFFLLEGEGDKWDLGIRVCDREIIPPHFFLFTWGRIVDLIWLVPLLYFFFLNGIDQMYLDDDNNNNNNNNNNCKDTFLTPKPKV